MAVFVSSSDRRELLVGIISLVVFSVIFSLSSFNKGEAVAPGAGYVLYASFQSVEGLSPGADIRMAGISIGNVEAYDLTEAFQARVRFLISGDVGIPIDSAAVIETDGLLGDKYIEVQPGGEENWLRSGQEFEYTQDSVILGDLLARVLEEVRHRQKTDVDHDTLSLDLLEKAVPSV